MLTLNDPSLFREQCYVNGQWIDADDKSVIKVDNPSKGEIIGSVPKFGAAETRRAIDAAEAAWAGWRALTPKERGACLIKWHDLIQENKQDLARILSYEQGKPVAEAKIVAGTPDARVRDASRPDLATGQFVVPARSAVVYVVQ